MRDKGGGGKNMGIISMTSLMDGPFLVLLITDSATAIASILSAAAITTINIDSAAASCQGEF